MNIQLEIVLQVLLSFVVGMLIGFDRERSGKAAGMRTQMLVCVGSGFYLPAFAATAMVLLLNPIAYVQYRYGLKSDYYHLVVKTDRRSIAERAIKYLHLEEKERKSKAGETTFKILSSNQRNAMLSELLDKKKVQYHLEVVED